MYNFTPEHLEYFQALEQGIKDIEANPQHWDQNHWHCGTSHCLAGFCDMRKAGLIDRLDETHKGYSVGINSEGISSEGLLDFDVSHFAQNYPYHGSTANIFNTENTLENLKTYLEFIREYGFQDELDLYGCYKNDNYFEEDPNAY